MYIANILLTATIASDLRILQVKSRGRIHDQAVMIDTLGFLQETFKYIHVLQQELVKVLPASF